MSILIPDTPLTPENIGRAVEIRLTGEEFQSQDPEHFNKIIEAQLQCDDWGFFYDYEGGVAYPENQEYGSEFAAELIKWVSA